MMSRASIIAGAGALLLALAATPLAAQQRIRTAAQPHAEQLSGELAKLREAATLESGGDLAGAERIVRGILDANPTSLSALLTLERLLTVQGRATEVGPVLDRLLELEPSSVIGHQTRLRVHAQSRNLPGLEAAAAAWLKSMPTIETPYREIAAIWRQRGEHGRAITLLEQGRRRVQRPDALALELGDAYIDAGDMSRAAAEWTRAVGLEGRGYMLVQRRLQTLSDGGASLIPALVDDLGATPHTAGRLRAAALFAIDAGLEPRAARFAQTLASVVERRERDPVLVELARRADAVGLHRVAAWAYAELLRDTRDVGATLSIRSRLAELALLTGDTALAAEVYRQLERASAAGSPQRRQALALRVQLTAREGDLPRAAADLERLRAEYPQAPELDQTAAVIAGRYLAAGDAESAATAISGVTGPRSTLLRGRMAIARGDLERGREELMAAAPQLRGREATEAIALAALLTRLSPAGGELLAQVVGAADGEREHLLRAAADRAGTLPAAERTAILDFLAATADRSGLLEDADELRREIVAAHPRAHEAPAALLALARRALGRAEAVDEARVLLEKIILEYPRSALAPQARRELERLQEARRGRADRTPEGT